VLEIESHLNQARASRKNAARSVDDAARSSTFFIVTKNVLFHLGTSMFTFALKTVDELVRRVRQSIPAHSTHTQRPSRHAVA
jgi:hypothetical protein